MSDKKRGKLIVIEGTDCSGKETQANRLVERLKSEGVPVYKDCFPKYETPTGRIVGGPVIGKSHICPSYFGEDAPSASGKVISLYYAADRLYNIGPIKEALSNGIHVILDRYTQSNMGFQAAKFENFKERKEMFDYIEKLEFELLELPKPDEIIFLYMPYEYACELKSKRLESADEVEKCEKYLKDAERTYLELSDIYNYKKIDCVKDNRVRTIEDIGEELYQKVKEMIS